MRIITHQDLLDIADSLFFYIRHGDDKHQQWLRDKSYEWVFQTLGNRATMTQETNFKTGKSDACTTEEGNDSERTT